MHSENRFVELGVRVLNSCTLVILVHLWQRVSVSVQVRRHLGPPNWEVLSHRFTEVGAVRGWLTHKVVEGLVWSVPSRGLHTKESADGEGHWESEHPAMSSTLDDWTHEWEAHKPADSGVRNELSRELLQLPVVKLLHPEDLIIC